NHGDGVHLEELDEDGRGDEFGGNKGNAHADVGIGPWNQEEEEEQESEGRAGLIRHGSLWRSSTDVENGWKMSLRGPLLPARPLKPVLARYCHRDLSGIVFDIQRPFPAIVFDILSGMLRHCR
ncbi:hypothetical protein BHM03_00056211, partial [Ensete ventricosum]